MAVTAHTIADARQLERAGADRVLIPYADVAAEVVDNMFGKGARQPTGVDDRNNTEGKA